MNKTMPNAGRWTRRLTWYEVGAIALGGLIAAFGLQAVTTAFDRNATGTESPFIRPQSDGRVVELIQLSARTRSGELVCWTPTGRRLGSRDQYPRQYRGQDDESVIELVFTIKARGPVLRTGVAFGPSARSRNERVFQEGWSLPRENNGTERIICDVLRPSGTESTLFFYIVDPETRTQPRVTPKTSKSADRHDAPMGKGPKSTSVDTFGSRSTLKADTHRPRASWADIEKLNPQIVRMTGVHLQPDR